MNRMQKNMVIMAWVLGGTVFSMASCNEKKPVDRETNMQTTPSPSPSEQKDSVHRALKQRVETIYKTVCDIYNASHEEMAELSEMNLDAKFCSNDWNRCLKEINAIDRRHPEEMGFFEADYWIMGQDWEKLSFKDVKVDSVSETTATVKLTLLNLNEIPVQLDMVFERGNWYIDNFHDQRNMDAGEEELDWKKNMKEYIEENQK